MLYIIDQASSRCGIKAQVKGQLQDVAHRREDGEIFHRDINKL